MTIELLLHHVLIKPEKVEETDELYKKAKAAGIQLQLDKREEAAVEFGFVRQVGPTAFKDYGRGPDILKVGDKVTFARYAGKPIKHDQEDLLIANDQDILAIIRGE